jgi:two-component system CheB/CheR fusion protein
LVLKPPTEEQRIARRARRRHTASVQGRRGLPGVCNRTNERAFEEIWNTLRTGKGGDFSHYKPGTSAAARCGEWRSQAGNTGGDAKYIKSNRDELDRLFNDILIQVTSFFRQPTTFTAISHTRATRHFERAVAGRSDSGLRPGLLYRRRAYSVVTTVLEHMRRAGVEIAVQLFGTDLSEVAPQQARSGVYPTTIEADVSLERLRRFSCQPTACTRSRDLCAICASSRGKT